MHFAIGMACTGAAAIVVCLCRRRGWWWLPLAMTAGGVWAMVPDLPRLFREVFPSVLAAAPGSGDLERRLHAMGDLFFFHSTLNAQAHEYASHSLVLILLFYNLAIVLLMFVEQRRGHSRANRAWRGRRRQLASRRQDKFPLVNEASTVDAVAHERRRDPVIARVRSSHLQRSA
jgi:hypothetical protein